MANSGQGKRRPYTQRSTGGNLRRREMHTRGKGNPVGGPNVTPYAGRRQMPRPRG